jgi:PIN domain nuclease of toxin-antitoxin system
VRVLDASALLALLNDEPGAESVAGHLEAGALISSVNYAEVVAKLCDYGMPEDAIREALASLDLQVEPFSKEHALTSGVLRTRTRHAGLSLGDRACLALARHSECTAVTADRHWAGLSDVDVELEFIR